MTRQPTQIDRALNRELLRAYGDILMRRHDLYLTNAVGYGQQIAKGLFLAHGGAMIALLTFIGSFKNPDGTANVELAVALSSSFWWFGWGLATALGVAGIGYLNFVALGSSTAAIHEIIGLIVHGMPVEKYGNDGDGVWITATLVGGIFAAVASLALFIGGVMATIATIAGSH